MQLLIEIFVFVIFAKNLTEFFSFEDIRINHDSNVLLINEITVTRQTTNFQAVVLRLVRVVEPD